MTITAAATSEPVTLEWGKGKLSLAGRELRWEPRGGTPRTVRLHRLPAPAGKGRRWRVRGVFDLRLPGGGRGRAFLEQVIGRKTAEIKRRAGFGRRVAARVAARREAIQARAQAYFARGETRKAKATLRNLVTAVPEAVEAAALLGDWYEAERNWEKALEFWARAGENHETFDLALRRFLKRCEDKEWMTRRRLLGILATHPALEPEQRHRLEHVRRALTVIGQRFVTVRRLRAASCLAALTLGLGILGYGLWKAPLPTVALLNAWIVLRILKRLGRRPQAT